MTDDDLNNVLSDEEIEYEIFKRPDEEILINIMQDSWLQSRGMGVRMEDEIRNTILRVGPIIMTDSEDESANLQYRLYIKGRNVGFLNYLNTDLQLNGLDREKLIARECLRYKLKVIDDLNAAIIRYEESNPKQTFRINKRTYHTAIFLGFQVGVTIWNDEIIGHLLNNRREQMIHSILYDQGDDD